MANIASGYLSIGIKEEEAAIELANSIKESGLFNYGGDVDIETGDDQLNIGFSCAWTGDDCWNWIDEQLSESSSLGGKCKDALRNAQIDGYTYEYGCQHRDRVHKPAGESKLEREQARIPDDIVNALKIAHAFSLSPAESRTVSGGTITMLSKSQSEDNQGESIYSFSIACGYSMELTLNINDSTLASEETEYSIVEIELEDWDPEDDDEDYDETSMFKEILDDIVAGFDAIYKSHSGSEINREEDLRLSFRLTTAPDGSLCFESAYTRLLNLLPDDEFYARVASDKIILDPKTTCEEDANDDLIDSANSEGPWLVTVGGDNNILIPAEATRALRVQPGHQFNIKLSVGRIVLESMGE